MKNTNTINPTARFHEGIIDVNGQLLVGLVADILEMPIEDVKNLQPNKNLTREEEDIIFACKSENDVMDYTIAEEMEDLECDINALIDIIYYMRDKV